ncbi:ABC transporter permease [Solicola sp. PLA-1-18]|uniref:ABC transporter permease n=1 Tax=Solicola sp. PLA-1-18 TaxID=3380532 RepID=UPI003B77CEF6
MTAIDMVLRQRAYFWTLFLRTWRGGIVSYTLLPVFFLLAMGLGLGGYVDRGPGDLGVTYLAFIAPGMLATNAMTTAVGESTYPVWVAFKWEPVYTARIATPLRVVDVLNGLVAYLAVRLTLTCAVMMVVLVAFGTVASVAGGVAAVLVGALLGLAYAMPVLALSASIEDDTAFALLFRLGILPMTLFSGAFFPISQLPGVLQAVAWLTPVWHGVESTRMLTTDRVDALALLGHLAYLALWVVAGWLLARSRFERRLADGGV